MGYDALARVRLNAHFDGKVIVPDEPLALKPNQRLRVHVEPIDQPPSQSHSRSLGLQRGAVMYIACDFDAELEDLTLVSSDRTIAKYAVSVLWE